MTKVTSSSAIATVTVAPDVLEKDVLLALVLTVLASPKQVKVNTKKKAQLTLTLISDDVFITERNAILRGLCSMVLHNALDGYPYYMMGGHSASTKASPSSAMAIAGISSWMSVASKVRSDPSSESDLLEELNTYLSTRAYLVPSASPTLADLDLTLALLETSSASLLESTLQPHHIHVRRWLEQCQETLIELSSTNDSIKIPSVPGNDQATPSSMPIFFYGNEENVALPSDPVAGGGGGKQKQPQKGAAASSRGTPAAAAAAPDTSGLTDEQKKAAADKRAKKNAEKAAKKKEGAAKKKGGGGGDTAAKELDISVLDIRVGKITKVWHHEEAEKLFCEEVDVGEEKTRNIASGLRPFYKSEDLQDRMVLVLCNLKARNLVGFPSHGMVLCASNDDHTKVEFVVPPPDAKIGERIMFEKYSGEPEAENKVAKKKMFEKIAPDLKTNDDGTVVWKDSVAMTSAGAVKAVNGMSNAHVS